MITAAGLVPFTTIDYPGKLAAVIFLQGCPLKCPFCHNFELQTKGAPTTVSWDEIWDFLEHRKKQLDGIILSGGEPLKHKEIKDLILKIKAFGYDIGIHTSGVYPDHLSDVISDIDWVGLDIKAPWEKYDLLTGRKGMDIPVKKSLEILLKSGKNFECRTTCDPRYLTAEDILKTGQNLSSLGVQTYILQHYRTFEADVNPPQPSQIESFFKDTTLQTTLQGLFPDYHIR